MTLGKLAKTWLQLRRHAGAVAGAALTLALCCPVSASGEASVASPVRLKVLGGLAGVTQFTRLEEPFWSVEIAQRTGGRLQASVHPFNRSGLRGEDMLRMMRLGVVPFGTVLVSLASADEPELNALDLPGMNPDIASLAATVEASRPRLRQLLQDRHGIDLLGVYAYPAQVMFCAKPFRGLADLSGRRIRTSSVSQSEFVASLGATPVIIPFAETVSSVSSGVVDCAITGTLSGYEIGLSEVTTHVHAMALSWGITLFGANRAALAALPADLREALRAGVRDLEHRIWRAAESETTRGLACNTGAQACGAQRGRLTLVSVTPQDEETRKRLVTGSVLPGWAARCGAPCAETWSGLLAQRPAGAARPE